MWGDVKIEIVHLPTESENYNIAAEGTKLKLNIKLISNELIKFAEIP